MSEQSFCVGVQAFETDIQFTVQNGTVYLYYKGAFDELMLSKLFHNLKAGSSILGRAYKRLFSIVVEIAQNIARHSMEKPLLIDDKLDNAGVGTLLVAESSDRFCIVSANVVTPQQATSLVEYVKRLSTLDEHDLRLLKRELLSRPLEKGQRGGRIGLVQIALKSDTPLLARRIATDYGYDYYILQAEIYKEVE